MRLYQIVLILMVLNTYLSNGQNDSLLQYYPLEKGNVYQYKHYRYSYRETLITSYKVIVGNDTVLTNGKMYKQLYCDNRLGVYSRIHPRYQRLDSISLQLFAYSNSGIGTEYMIDSLLVNGNSYNYFGGTRLFKAYPRTGVINAEEKVFGQSVYCRRYGTGNQLLEWLSFKVVRGLGITTIAFSDESGDDLPLPNYYCYDTLVYALINGKEHGTTLAVQGNLENNYQFELFQNYPNPFNPSTTISFTLSKPQYVTLSVFDNLGREVLELIRNQMNAGTHSVYFNAKEFSSGLYVYRLSTENYSKSKQMILLK